MGLKQESAQQCAAMSDCNNFFCTEGRLVAAESSTAIIDPLYHSVHALKVLPDKSANSQVLSDILIWSISQNVLLCGALDQHIVNVRHRNFGYFKLQDICDIIMEY